MWDTKKIWKGILGELEVSVSRPNFHAWLEKTDIASFDEMNGEMTISVPDNFTKEWLEKKYHKMIVSAAENLTGSKIQHVVYRIISAGSAPAPVGARTTYVMAKPATTISLPYKENGLSLNEKYGFDNFVVGKSNELAYAAALVVAEKPGEKYNPLFLYGGVGLGKTHLLQAIGNAIRKRSPEKKVLYTTGEKFTNEFVQSVRNGEMDKFKRAHRYIDLFIVDDVQFLSGKDRAQEEFFHTFNELSQNNRQIVVTCDRPPKVLPAIEDRLTSRLGSGMIADIAAPDLETRIAIIQNKAKQSHIEFLPEIYQYIAARFQNNVRELESALNKIIAYAELTKKNPTLDMVKDQLSGLFQSRHKPIVNTRQLIEIISEFYNIKGDELISKSRRKELVVPRQIAMYLLREELNASFPLIGKELGGRDHTTAMHAYMKIKREIANETKIKQDIDYIRQIMYSNQ